jgi:hypothetical protein
MPQPLSKVRTSKFSRWGTIVMRSRPQLALLVVEIVAAWAETEAQLVQLLSTLLKSEKAVGMSMYLNVSGAEARRAMLDGAAEKSLSAEDHALYSKTMKAIRPVRNRRNEFAHGIWGNCDELPEALLWAKAEARLAHDIAIHEARLAGDNDKVAKLAKSQMPGIMVFRGKDLQRDYKNAFLAIACVMDLNGAIDHSRKNSAEMRQQLLRSPLLRGLGDNPHR